MTYHWYLLVSLLGVSACGNTPSPTPDEFFTEVQTVRILNSGTCYDFGGDAFELERFELDWNANQSGAEISVEGDSLIIHLNELQDPVRTAIPQIVRQYFTPLSTGTRNAATQTVRYDNQDWVYWRETDQDGVYLQGLLTMNESGIVSACVGRGGTRNLH